MSVAASSEKGKKYMNNEKHTVLFKKKKKEAFICVNIMFGGAQTRKEMPARSKRSLWESSRS